MSRKTIIQTISILILIRWELGTKNIKMRQKSKTGKALYLIKDDYISLFCHWYNFFFSAIFFLILRIFIIFLIMLRFIKHFLCILLFFAIWISMVNSATLLICRNTNKESSINLNRFIMIIKIVRTIPFIVFFFIVTKKFQNFYCKISMSGSFQKI